MAPQSLQWCHLFRGAGLNPLVERNRKQTSHCSTIIRQ
jgi:hypothetical protein